MRALVFEQWQGGHYFNYLEYLVPRLAGICDEVVVAVSDVAAASALFERQLGMLRTLPNVRIDDATPIPAAPSAFAMRRRITRHLVDAARRHAPDCVFLPSADEQLLSLPVATLRGAGLPRGTPVEAVIHYKAYTADANARERSLSALQRQLLRSGAFSQLNFVNCLQYEDAVARRLSCAGIARAAGDPVPQPPRIDRARARAALGLPSDGRLVGMIGALDARKAVRASLAAFRAARLARGDRFLLAGQLIPEYADAVRDEYADLVRDGTLLLMDRFLSVEELANGFAALDLHCSVYQSFSGLSSLMLKSVAAGVPVLVNDRPGWTRAIARRFDLGWAVDPQDVAGFAATLRAALDASAGYRETPAVRRLLQFHSIDNFTAGLTERVSTLAGKAPAPVIQWPWVLEALPAQRRALR